MGSSNDKFPHKFVLYTNHTCTWANRANIALAELSYPFEERIINVDGPRPASFLALNPRGLVPVLIVDDEHVIIESAIICQFLADLAASSHQGRQLCPPLVTTTTTTTTTAIIPAPQVVVGGGAGAGALLTRAKMAFFIDAYWTRFHSLLFGLFEAPTPQDEERIINEAVQRVVGEMEPLLVASYDYPRSSVDDDDDDNDDEHNGPFFGGSREFTLVEVVTGPFLVRAMALSRRGVYPSSLARRVESEAPRFAAWAGRVAERESVKAVFDEEVIVKRSVAKRERMRRAAGLV